MNLKMTLFIVALFVGAAFVTSEARGLNATKTRVLKLVPNHISSPMVNRLI